MLLVFPPSDPRVNHMILEHAPFEYNKIASYDDLLILVVSKLVIDIW
jgi:hypothetical protein